MLGHDHIAPCTETLYFTQLGGQPPQPPDNRPKTTVSQDTGVETLGALLACNSVLYRGVQSYGGAQNVGLCTVRCCCTAAAAAAAAVAVVQLLLCCILREYV